MGPRLLLLALVFLLLPAPALACPNGWTNCFCSDDNTLFMYENIPTSSATFTANTSIDCRPNKCNNDTRTCANPYDFNAVQASFSMPLFLVLFLVSLGSLVFGVAKKHWLFCMFSTIMFGVLAMQSFALEAILVNTMFYSFVTVFMGLFWFLMFVSLLFTLIGMVGGLRGRKKQDGMGGAFNV